MNRHRGQGAGRDSSGDSGGSGGSGECAEFQPLLEDLYLHALPPEQERRVANHLAGCVICSATLGGFAATDRLIAGAPVARPGTVLRQRLAQRIAAERIARPDDHPGSMLRTPIKRTRVVDDIDQISRDSWTARRRTTAGKGWQRIRVVIGTLAAALIVVLLVGTLLSRAHGTSPRTTGNSPAAHNPTAAAACAPGKIHATIPTNSYLADLAMVSPGEGWAVGSIDNTQHFGPENALVMHYHNCAWTPIAIDIPGGDPTSISMVSATEGWAVGNINGDTPLALHYTKGSWQQVALPIGGIYVSVKMLSADEGWIIVNHAKDQHGLLSQSLLHLVNGVWSEVTPPFSMVDDVLPVAPNDAWVAGLVSDARQDPVLYHYHGGTWSQTALPSGVVLDHLRMVTPNDIWASGHINAPTNWNVDQSAAVLHYDGSQWRQAPVSASGHPQIVEALDDSTSWAITLQNSRDAGGFGYDISQMQYQQSGAWHTVKQPFANASDVLALTRVAKNSYWALGYYMVTEPNTNGTGFAGYSMSVLLYFTDGAWHAYSR